MGRSFRAGDYAEVFEHFPVSDEDREDESCYAYAPVFPARVADQQAVLKRTCSPLANAESVAGWLNRLWSQGIPVVTPLPIPAQNPAKINDAVWVAYPWIDGRPYNGTPADVAAAGDLLGRIHAAQPPERPIPTFSWPDHDAASVAEDITGLQRVFGRYAPEIRDAVLARLAPQLESFMQETLPVIRDADLPRAPVTLDFKANNLVFTNDGPVLIELTPVERILWPVALRYVMLEWGVWTLIAGEEWGDWVDPHKRAFLTDLAGTDEHRFQLV